MKKETREKTSSDKKYNTYAWIIIIIFAASIALRLFGMNNMMYDDEGTRAFAIEGNGLMGNLIGKDTWHPPMYSWLAMASTSLFGFSDIALRSVHLLFGILTIYLVFVFARRYFGRKAAMWSTAIMGLSYYHLLASVLITIDGSILAFFYLLTLYCFMRYFENREDKKNPQNEISIGIIKKIKIDPWLALTGAGFGLAMLTKVSGILLIPVIAAYSLLRTKSIKSAVLDTLIVGIIGSLIFSVYPILSIFDSSGLALLFERATGVVADSPTNFALLAIQFVFAAIWMGPLLIGLLLLAIFSNIRKEERDSNTHLLLVFIGAIVAFYVFIIRDNFRPVERYFMALTAPISILAGAYLSKIKFGRKHAAVFLAVFIAFSGFLLWLNAKENEYLPFYPKEAFIKKALAFDWAVYVPLVGNEGPLGFYLSLDSIVYSFLFASIAVLVYIAIKYSARGGGSGKPGKQKKNHAGYYAASALVIFMAVSAAFNFLIAEEYLFAKINPDIDRVSREMVDYANAHQLKKPLFVFRNFAMQFYMQDKYGKCPFPNNQWWSDCAIDFGDQNGGKKLDLLEKGGTVLVVDFPKISRESALWKKFSGCEKLKSFYDKDQEIGFVIEC